MTQSPTIHATAVLAGSRTVNLAPMRFGSPSSSRPAVRFSATMVPRCASTIWREMERPSPEFWPKPASGRSV